jgi:hypothetical protein
MPRRFELVYALYRMFRIINLSIMRWRILYRWSLFGFRLVAGIFRLLLYNSLKSKVLGKIEFN